MLIRLLGTKGSERKGIAAAWREGTRLGAACATGEATGSRVAATIAALITAPAIRDRCLPCAEPGTELTRERMREDAKKERIDIRIISTNLQETQCHITRTYKSGTQS